jgi:hypothetical protein
VYQGGGVTGKTVCHESKAAISGQECSGPVAPFPHGVFLNGGLNFKSKTPPKQA